jgi:hypothetical protein
VLLSDFEIPGKMYRDGSALMALLRRTYPSTKVIFVHAHQSFASESCNQIAGTWRTAEKRFTGRSD